MSEFVVTRVPVDAQPANAAHRITASTVPACNFFMVRHLSYSVDSGKSRTASNGCANFAPRQRACPLRRGQRHNDKCHLTNDARSATLSNGGARMDERRFLTPHEAEAVVDERIERFGL